MDLTKDELRELDGLRKMLPRPVLMTQLQHDRLNSLNKKQMHNCCSNPHCIGFHDPIDTKRKTCPECGEDLFKFPDDV